MIPDVFTVVCPYRYTLRARPCLSLHTIARIHLRLTADMSDNVNPTDPAAAASKPTILIIGGLGKVDWHAASASVPKVRAERLAQMFQKAK